MAIIDRIKEARKNTQQKASKRRTKKKARRNKKTRKKKKRRKRIKRSNPKGVYETTVVAGRELKGFGSDLGEFASATVPEAAKTGARRTGSAIRRGYEYAAEYEPPDYDSGFDLPDYSGMGMDIPDYSGGGSSQSTTDWSLGGGGGYVPNRGRSGRGGGRRHAYRKAANSSDYLKYVKHHDGKGKTEIRAEKMGTSATGTSWVVFVDDSPTGTKRVGRFQTKESARRAMTRWMNSNPDGITKGGMY